MHPRAVLLALACAVALGAAAACGTLSPEPDTASPCLELAAECGSCTTPGAKETCTTAVDSADDVQCTAALSDPSVVAACTGDAGADAEGGAPPLPACAPDGGASPDAECACAADSGPCAPTCDPGGCKVECTQGATCAGSCAGGGCTFDCKKGSICHNTCAGGGCTFQCEIGAICADTCSADASPCIGS